MTNPGAPRTSILNGEPPMHPTPTTETVATDRPIHKDDPTPVFPDPLLRLPAVVKMAGISRTEIYRRIEAGIFP